MTVKTAIAEFQDFSRKTACCTSKEHEIMNWAVRLWAELAQLQTYVDDPTNNPLHEEKK